MTSDELAVIKAIIEQNDSIIEQNFMLLDALFPMKIIRLCDDDDGDCSSTIQ